MRPVPIGPTLIALSLRVLRFFAANLLVISSTLDESTVNRAAPPGSMRYFAILYTPAAQRAAVAALYVIDAEIRESACSGNHDVAHTRLQWWRQEIDRLVNGHPQHPATRVLAAHAVNQLAAFGKLHEPLVAADMDLARMTYLSERELQAYCTRSGGAIQELVALTLTSPATLDEATRTAANLLGCGIRRTEMLRDMRQDALDGRLYVPLERMEQHGVTPDALRAREIGDRERPVLQAAMEAAQTDLDAGSSAIARTARASLRPLFVLAALHREVLHLIARRNFAIGRERIELGPLRKPWTAWRAARAAR